MYSLSKYVQSYKVSEEDALLYDSVKGNAFLIKSHLISVDGSNVVASKEIEEFLRLRICDVPDKKEVRGVYESKNKLYISLETFLRCNLACPYCYQVNNSYSKKSISRENLDLLFLYIQKVYSKTHFEILNFKILGGEPSVDWSPGAYILENVSCFCKTNGIKLDLYIDTNGTLIKDFLLLSGYDSLTFNVPLCYEECHNKYRSYKNGRGTYRTIIENVNSLSTLSKIKILLRHNTDSYNVNFFDVYLKDLKKSLTFEPIIMPFYTTDPVRGDYKNPFSYFDYVDWRSSKCISGLIESGFNVNFSPRTYLEGECQQQSKYSLKLFSSGKVGACAVNFFDEDNPFLSEIMEGELISIERYWGGAKGIKVLRDSYKCRDCKSLYTCLGDYNLPCIKKLGIKECAPERNVYLNLGLYFSELYRYYCKGKGNKFKAINIFDLR